MEFQSPSTSIPTLPTGTRLCHDDEPAAVGDYVLCSDRTWRRLLLSKPDFYRLGNGSIYCTSRPEGERIRAPKEPGERNSLSKHERATIRARWASRPTYKRLAEEYGVGWRVIQDAVQNRNRRKK